MVRATAAILTAGLALAALPAVAQTPPPDSDSRYSFHKVENGFLRLDTRTGQVSLCNHKALGWACELIPDERVALENEIARLQDSNAALKKDMLARGLPLPNSAANGGSAAKPGAPGEKDEPREQSDLKLPSQADVDRVVTFMERVWRRLVEMMNNVQKDGPGKS